MNRTRATPIRLAAASQVYHGPGLSSTAGLQVNVRVRRFTGRRHLAWRVATTIPLAQRISCAGGRRIRRGGANLRGGLRVARLHGWILNARGSTLPSVRAAFR